MKIRCSLKTLVTFKNKQKLLLTVMLFIAAEIALGVLLQITHGRAVAYLSYAAVVLACLFCILFAECSKAYLLTQFALVCTVCADYFLVLCPERQQLPAMLFFSAAQLAYFGRLYFENESQTRRWWHLISRIVSSATVLLVTAAVLGPATDAVALVSMFYYANLLLNIVFAFLQFERPGLFAIGLLLFACCDTLIGLSFLDAYLPIGADSPIYLIIHPGFDLAWAFYVPSQTLLAISLLPNRLKNKF